MKALRPRFFREFLYQIDNPLKHDDKKNLTLELLLHTKGTVFVYFPRRYLRKSNEEPFLLVKFGFFSYLLIWSRELESPSTTAEKFHQNKVSNPSIDLLNFISLLKCFFYERKHTVD